MSIVTAQASCSNAGPALQPSAADRHEHAACWALSVPLSSAKAAKDQLAALSWLDCAKQPGRQLDADAGVRLLLPLTSQGAAAVQQLSVQGFQGAAVGVDIRVGDTANSGTGISSMLATSQKAGQMSDASEHHCRMQQLLMQGAHLVPAQRLACKRQIASPAHQLLLEMERFLTRKGKTNACHCRLTHQLS